jgi:hypothetical protein
MVRVEPNNDLVLGVESVTVNGRRYALRTDNGRVESLPDRRLVSAIVGDSGGSQVPRDTLLSFRILRPLEMTVPDRGIEFDRP